MKAIAEGLFSIITRVFRAKDDVKVKKKQKKSYAVVIRVALFRTVGQGYDKTLLRPCFCLYLAADETSMKR